MHTSSRNEDNKQGHYQIPQKLEAMQQAPIQIQLIGLLGLDSFVMSNLVFKRVSPSKCI